jgi:antitoxin MazE
MTTIQTNLVKVGNSQSVRIPKVILQQIDFSGGIELEVQDEQLVLRPIKKVRNGWNERFKEMHKRGDDAMLEPMQSTTWEEEEWKW